MNRDMNPPQVGSPEYETLVQSLPGSIQSELVQLDQEIVRLDAMMRDYASRRSNILTLVCAFIDAGWAKQPEIARAPVLTCVKEGAGSIRDRIIACVRETPGTYHEIANRLGLAANRVAPKLTSLYRNGSVACIGGGTHGQPRVYAAASP